jgi:hypothetical protein
MFRLTTRPLLLAALILLAVPAVAQGALVKQVKAGTGSMPIRAGHADTWVIGNVFDGWRMDVQGPPVNGYRWGYIYNGFDRCAWLDASVLVDPNPSSPTPTSNRCPDPFEYPLNDFSYGIVGSNDPNSTGSDGAWTQINYYKPGCNGQIRAYGNVRPWAVPAQSLSSLFDMSNGLAVKWRYVSKDGQWVLIHDPTNDPWGGWPPNWYFVKRQCINLPGDGNASSNGIGAARNADGRLELFGVNTHIPDGQNNVFHAWQTSPGGGAWSGWYGLNGYLTSVAVATNKDGRLEVFGANAHIPDGQNNVFHAWQTSPGGAWSGWYPLNGYLTSVGAARNADGRLELFGVNTHIPDGQNNVFHAWQTSPGGALSGWYGMNGYLTSIAAATNKDGRLELFGANAHLPDGQNDVFHAWQTSPGGALSGWYGMNGYLG